MAAEISGAEANRIFYARFASTYDEHEECVTGERGRRQLRDAIDRATALVGPRARVLDAGGGSGNASSLLVERGLDPLLVDVSPEMAGRWRAKAVEMGVEPKTELADVAMFLAEDSREWDLIVFSSVLHHLEDPAAVLRSAIASLAPGGVIVTAFDPTQLSATARAARRFDWMAWTALHHPGRALELARKRLGGGSGAVSEADRVGHLAERHAHSGMDERLLAAEAERAGCSVLIRRGYEARLAPVRMGFRAARTPTSFSFLIRKDGA